MRDGYKSGATLTGVPLRQTHLLIGATLRYPGLYSATLSDMNAGFIYPDTCVCKVKKSGMLQIHQTCIQVRYSSLRFVKLISYQPGRHLEHVKF